MTAADEAVVTEQLQRRPRGVVGVAYRCPAGHPGVVATLPRLPDGTPFPTTFYLTCPRAVAACSTLEATGLMAELSERLAAEPELAAAYARAHHAYLFARESIAADTVGPVPEIAEVSSGGMPTRVKFLHALLGHALAAGPGVNPIGDLTLELIQGRWSFPCPSAETESNTEREKPPSGSES